MSQATPLLVSIVTAVYNREETIGEAVESVSRQTYPHIEHLIIDGASRDHSVERARTFARPSAVIVSEPDHGLYDAFNKGVQRATGEVIGFAHSDDFLANAEVIATVARVFEDPKVDAVYGDLDYVAARDPNRIVRRWRSGEFQRRKLGRGWMPPHPALFLRRRVYERYGSFDTGFRIAADYDFILRIFSKDELRFVYIPEVFVKMRIGGISNRSLRNIFRKSREDLHALRRNKVGGIGTLLAKNIGKLPQFIGIKLSVPMNLRVSQRFRSE